jgi:hypothetical protein
MTAATVPDRGVLPALFVCLLLAGAGASLLAWSVFEVADARRALRTARAEHAKAEQRHALEQRQRAEWGELERAHRKLVARGIVGAERRLEWSEALAYSRNARQLADLHYQIEPRRGLYRPGGDERVTAYASLLKFQASLLHEGDLLGLLEDLRDSVRALQVPRRCAIQRIPQATPHPLAPRLKAECEIDLFTVEMASLRP